MGKKSGGGGPQTTTQEPWGPQRPYLTDVMGQAKSLYNQPGPYYYPYSGVANMNPDIQSGQSMLRNYAMNGATQQAGQAANASNFGLSGAVLDPSTNPWLAKTASAAIRPATEQFTQQVLPNIGSAAQRSGAYGGARQGIVESNALRDYGRNILDTTAGLYSQGYGQGLDYMGRALGLAPQTQQMGAVPAQFMDALGQQNRAYEQQLINDDMARWAYYQQLPYTELSEYSNSIQGNYGGSMTQPGMQTSPLAGAAGGALTGASLASLLGGPVGWMAGAGALLGLL